MGLGHALVLPASFHRPRARTIAMVDATVYASIDETPELAVRQIFVKTRMPGQLRRLCADKGLLDADAWAAVADTLETFKANIQRLLTEAAIDTDAPAREAKLISLATCWRKCRALAEGRDTRRARLEEDPHRIPEMGIQEYGQKRANFVIAHKDFLLTDFKEPHKRFLERFDRDFAIREVVLPHAIGEIRVKSEHVQQKGGSRRLPSSS